MGFWSGLGKGLLKAAPIAASFIPGVGPLAAMGIGAGAGAASKKLEGGSWGDAAGGALGGAATAGMGSMIKGGLGKGYDKIKGLGPSEPPGAYLPKTPMSVKMGNLPWGNIAKGAAIGGGALALGKGLSNMGGNKNQQGIGPSYGGWENRTPNMENYIQQGRQEAMMGQPWRQDRGIFPQQMPQYNPTQMPPWLQQGGGQMGGMVGSKQPGQFMNQMGGPGQYGGMPQGRGMGMSPQMMQQVMQMRQNMNQYNPNQAIYG